MGQAGCRIYSKLLFMQSIAVSLTCDMYDKYIFNESGVISDKNEIFMVVCVCSIRIPFLIIFQYIRNSIKTPTNNTIPKKKTPHGYNRKKIMKS